jgi:hypothetical protein
VRGADSEQGEYRLWAAERCVRALERALAEAVEVRLAAGAGHEAEIATNSRVLLSDGTIGWVGFTADETVGPTGPIDPRVGFVRAVREDGTPLATLVNYSLHSTLRSRAGSGGYWPGYPGKVCAEVERRLGGRAIFVTGACGNIHNLSRHVAEEAADRLAAEVTRSTALVTPTAGPFGLRAARRRLLVPARQYSGCEMDEIRRVLTIRGNASDALLAGFEQRLADARARYGPEVELDVQAIAFGDTCIVAVPGELFVEFGIEIKTRSTFRHTFVVELAHQYISYIPTPHALVLGGYQTWTGVLCHPTAGEIIVDACHDLVRGLAR